MLRPRARTCCCLSAAALNTLADGEALLLPLASSPGLPPEPGAAEPCPTCCTLWRAACSASVASMAICSWRSNSSSPLRLSLLARQGGAARAKFQSCLCAGLGCLWGICLRRQGAHQPAWEEQGPITDKPSADPQRDTAQARMASRRNNRHSRVCAHSIPVHAETLDFNA